MGIYPIIPTGIPPIAPQRSYEDLSDVCSLKTCWMWPTLRPVDICYGPVGIQGSIEHVYKSWNVMLIWVASRQAISLEEVVVFSI